VASASNSTAPVSPSVTSPSASASASASVSTSTIPTDTVIASLTVDSAIPSVAVGDTLNLAEYIHFKNAANEEIPYTAVTKLVFALDTMKTVGIGTLTDESNPLLFTAEMAGAVQANVSCQGTAADKTLTAPLTFAVTANSDITSLTSKWSQIHDNFTLTTSQGFGSQVSVRTPNYVSYGDGKGLIVSAKDKEAYPFVFENKDTTKLTVLNHDRGVGTEVLEKHAPAMAITEGNFRKYQALSKVLKGSYDYFLMGKPLLSMMQNLGLDSTLISTSSGDYYLAYLGVKTTGTDYTFTAYGISAASQIASFGDFSFSAIGSSSIASLDSYITAKSAPEKTDISPLATKIKTIADSHNYTLDGTANFYAKDSTTPLDLSKQSAFVKSLSETVRKSRQMLLTTDGMWMHYYQANEDTDNVYDEINAGYLNHTDGTVYTFSMVNGTAVLGSQDLDYATYTATQAPYWNTYKKGLGMISEERLEKGSLTFDNSLYQYEYQYDLNNDSPEKALGSNALDLLYPELYDIFTTSDSGTPIIQAEKISFAYDDASITLAITIPVAITETLASDLKVTLKASAFGTTVITGLKDILSGTPTGGDDGGDY
jgi:hypothetical protein